MRNNINRKFYDFCKTMHSECLTERRNYGEKPIKFEEYCRNNATFLEDKFKELNET